MEAPLPFLRPARIEIVGRFHPDLRRHIFSVPFENRKIGLFLLPHFKASDLLLSAQGEFECDAFLYEHELLRALEIIIKRAKDILCQQGADFSILMAHHLFGHTHYAGSELFLGLSGLESIPTTLFSGKFDYLALGHLHAAQISAEEPKSIYPGSPIPLHFGEGNQKAISLLEISSQGLEQKWQAIPCFRSILSVAGKSCLLPEKLAVALEKSSSTLPAFVEIKIEGTPLEHHDETLLFEIAKKYAASILKISCLVTPADQSADESITALHSHDLPTSLSLPDVFRAFHRQKYQGADPSSSVMQTFLKSLEEWSQHKEEMPSDENQASHPT